MNFFKEMPADCGDGESGCPRLELEVYEGRSDPLLGVYDATSFRPTCDWRVQLRAERA